MGSRGNAPRGMGAKPRARWGPRAAAAGGPRAGPTASRSPELALVCSAYYR
jgi:hypothetical protein